MRHITPILSQEPFYIIHIHILAFLYTVSYSTNKENLFKS